MLMVAPRGMVKEDIFLEHTYLLKQGINGQRNRCIGLVEVVECKGHDRRRTFLIKLQWIQSE